MTTTEMSAERKRELRKLAKGGGKTTVVVASPPKKPVDVKKPVQNAPVEEQKKVFIEMLAAATTDEERAEIFSAAKDFIKLKEFNEIVAELTATQAPTDGPRGPVTSDEPVLGDQGVAVPTEPAGVPAMALPWVGDMELVEGSENSANTGQAATVEVNIDVASIPGVPEEAVEDIVLTESSAPVSTEPQPAVSFTRRERRNQRMGYVPSVEAEASTEDDPIAFLTDLGKAIRAEFAKERATERSFHPRGPRNTGRYQEDKPRQRRRVMRRGKNRRKDLNEAEETLEREFEPTDAMIMMCSYIAERLLQAEMCWGIVAISKCANKQVFNHLAEIVEITREVEIMRQALAVEERRARAEFAHKQEEARALLASVKEEGDPKLQFPAPTKRRKPLRMEWIKTGEAGSVHYQKQRPLRSVINPVKVLVDSLTLKFAAGEIPLDAFEEKQRVLAELTGQNGSFEDTLMLFLAEGKLSADEFGRLKFLRRQAQKQKEEAILAFAQTKISPETFACLMGE